jgi:hypothetical protein
VFETILALRNAWPIAKSSFFMTYGARNGEKTTTPNRSPLTPGKITLKIKNRVQTPLFQHVVASDGTQIKIEPLLEASGPTVESTMSLIGGVPEEELVQENTTVMSSSTSSGAATTTSSSSSSASTQGPPKKAKVLKN